MHWSLIRGPAASAGVQLKADETEVNAALWTLEAQEGLCSLYLPT